MAATALTHDHLYILHNLVEKDFKVRYRNMSLGIFWSLVNPLIMMGVLMFVFSVVFRSAKPNFPLFVLMGLLPYNYFNLAWSTGTNSIVDSGNLIKKVSFLRELVPIAAVLGSTVHYVIQLLLLLIAAGLVIGVNPQWVWLPLVIVLQMVFACGAALFTAGLDVYYRDIRYVVESINLVLFWLVPIFYGFEDVPSQYSWLYELNPLAAVILITRRILLYGVSPGWTLAKLAIVSVVILAVGGLVFGRVKRDFSDYL